MEYDYSEWSEHRLLERLNIVQETAQINHTEKRRQQIDRELAHLAFELEYREEFYGNQPQ